MLIVPYLTVMCGAGIYDIPNRVVELDDPARSNCFTPRGLAAWYMLPKRNSLCRLRDSP